MFSISLSLSLMKRRRLLLLIGAEKKWLAHEHTVYISRTRRRSYLKYYIYFLFSLLLIHRSMKTQYIPSAALFILQRCRKLGVMRFFYRLTLINSERAELCVSSRSRLIVRVLSPATDSPQRVCVPSVGRLFLSPVRVSITRRRQTTRLSRARARERKKKGLPVYITYVRACTRGGYYTREASARRERVAVGRYAAAAAVAATAVDMYTYIHIHMRRMEEPRGGAARVNIPAATEIYIVYPSGGGDARVYVSARASADITPPPAGEQKSA